MNLLDLVSKEQLLKYYNLQPKTELDCFDFKREFSVKGSSGIEMVKDIAAFANSKGGTIIFGVTNDFEWIGLGESSDSDIDEAEINKLCEKYIDGKVNLSMGLYEIEELEFLIMYIEASSEILPFKIIGQYVKSNRKNKQQDKIVFREGDVFCRRGSRSMKANSLFFKQKKMNFELLHNLPSPPYHDFIGRNNQIDKLHDLLMHKNTRLLQVNGIGGIGKTSLVYYYCELLQKKEFNHDFEFIIWMSGKRTYFTPNGERKISDFISSYQDVISEIYNFFHRDKINDENSDDYGDTLIEVQRLLEEYKILLVVDNLETLIEEELINFLFNIPSNSKVILTTRESIADFQMSIITLQGFEEDQEFIDFLEREYSRRTEDSFSELYGKYASEIYKYTKGMPLAIQLVVNQLSLNADIKIIIRSLSRGNTYNSLLEFCFMGVIERLNEVQKSVLYILALPEVEHFFTIEDINLIANYTDDDIMLALQQLSNFSLCYKEKREDERASYATPHLAKLYIRDFKFENAKLLIERYSEYSREIIQIASHSEQYIKKTGAKNHSEKMAASKMANIMMVYYNHGYNEAMKIIDKLISEVPQFGYLYFQKGFIEKEAKITNYKEETNKAFSMATRLSPDQIFYWIEWAYFAYDEKQYFQSKKYFEEALRLDSKSTRANHGYAKTLATLYKKGRVSLNDAQKAREHFELGYHEERNIVSEEQQANAINAHAFSKFLYSINDLENALKECERGLRCQPYNDRLKSLKGEIKKAKINKSKPDKPSVFDKKQRMEPYSNSIKDNISSKDKAKLETLAKQLDN
ncbi:NB-ARC domain-containing protein [Sporosarcina koreensis]|uniref:NB-ARC domain-containing protein n=1 Tax=Sporosarcina koreensis TaxID=334735 RepID=UPI000759244B|nr:RNA-binding domain-containing protein [Sporosarcina koreensis]